MYMLRILPKTDAGARPALEVATENLEEILDWQKQIETARNAIETHQLDLTKQEEVLMQQSRSKRIALEMSDLVIYCGTVPFSLESECVFVYHMTSCACMMGSSKAKGLDFLFSRY